jgi:hypothetical protein
LFTAKKSAHFSRNSKKTITKGSPKHGQGRMASTLARSESLQEVTLESKLFLVKRYCPRKQNTSNRERQYIFDFHIRKQKELPYKCFVTVIPTLNVICQQEMHEKLSSKNARHNISHH